MSQPGISAAEVFAMLKAGDAAGLFSGALGGAPAPKHITGRFYPSHLHASDASGLTTTSTRIYYLPYYISEIRSYAGFVMRNAGAGDSGKKVRMGLYTHSAVNGPTTLVQAATEITFAGAAADNTTANAFIPTYIGWHWIAAQFDVASSVRRSLVHNYQLTAVGSQPIPAIAPFFGVITVSGDLVSVPISAYYVDTTYAALAATAVAPTATTDIAPWLGLIA